MVDTLSMDAKFGEDDGVSLGDFITNSESQDPQALYYREKISEEIDNAIEFLSPREKFIINSYFGLKDNKSENFAQIAEKMGLSRERVRQLQIIALEKIREKVSHHKEKFEEYFKNNEL